MNKIIILNLGLFLIGCIENTNDRVSIDEIMNIETNQKFQNSRIIINNLEYPEYFINSGDSVSIGYYNGKINQLSRIENGTLNGAHVEFRQNGELYFTGFYSNKVADGLFKNYDSSGKLHSVECYLKGIKIFTECVDSNDKVISCLVEDKTLN